MKTKHILICMLCTFLIFPLAAQNKSQSYIAFSLGGSAPLGDFSKSDPGTFENPNHTAGFAKTRFAAGFEGAYYFSPKIGLAGTLYFSDHGGFSKEDAAKLGDHYTDAFGVDESTVSTTSRYRTLNLMVGPQVSFPMKKITIDVRALGGLLKSFPTCQPNAEAVELSCLNVD